MRDQRRAVRRRPLVRLAPAALLVTGLTCGCTGSSSDEPEESSTPSATALSDIDLSGVVADRAAFCDALDPESVATVLGGEPEQTDGYESGQRAELAPGLRDVANEYSCTFGRGPRTARAWLFAQPVGPGQARTLIEQRGSDKSCEPAGDVSFGDPGLVQSCRSEARRRVTAAGLFGDGWLTCQVTVPQSVDEADLLEQAQRWCAEVAQATAR
jgi:hypothetical protein